MAFLANITQNQQGTHFAETIVQQDSALDGISLKSANIQEQTGLVIIAIRDKDGGFLYNPPEDKKIEAGEGLLVIASQRQLQTLRKLTGDLN